MVLCWVDTYHWESRAQDFWPRECVQDMGVLFKTASLYQSDLSRPNWCRRSAAEPVIKDIAEIGVFFNFIRFWTKAGARNDRRSHFFGKMQIQWPSLWLDFTHIHLLLLVSWWFSDSHLPKLEFSSIFFIFGPMRGAEVIEGVIFWQNANSMTLPIIRFYTYIVTFLGLMMIFILTFAETWVFFNFLHFRTDAGARSDRRSHFSAKCQFNDPP